MFTISDLTMANEEGSGIETLTVHVPLKPEQYYYIKNSGYVLTLNGDTNRPDQLLAGTRIVIKEKIRDRVLADSQMWYFEDAGDGFCYIVSKLNGFVLDIQEAKWTASTPIILWPKNSPPTVIANQKWKIDVKKGTVVSQLNGQLLHVQQPGKPGSLVVMMGRKGIAEEAQPQTWEFEPIS